MCNFTKQVTLLEEGLMNEVKFHLQNLRKEMEFDVVSKAKCFLNLGELPSKLNGFTSPNCYFLFKEWFDPFPVKYTPMGFLMGECQLNKFVVQRNQMWFNGTDPVHDESQRSFVDEMTQLPPFVVKTKLHPNESELTFTFHLKQ